MDSERPAELPPEKPKHRHVSLRREETGVYTITNARGGTMRVGGSEGEEARGGGKGVGRGRIPEGRFQIPKDRGQKTDDEGRIRIRSTALHDRPIFSDLWD